MNPDMGAIYARNAVQASWVPKAHGGFIMLKRIVLALGVAMAGEAGAETTHKGHEMPP